MNIVVMPVYNEESTVASAVATIRKFWDYDLIAIDDGSTDLTPSILKELDLTYVVTHNENVGYGGALISGFDYAIKEKFTHLLTIDADGQHDPRLIPLFFEEIEECDIVSGTRYHNDSPIMTPAPEKPRIINERITKIIKSLLGLRITDSFCGFKAYRVEKLAKLRLSIQDYAFPLQLWVQAVGHGLEIEEFPVPLIVSNPRRNYERILGSVEETIEYYREVIRDEIERRDRPADNKTE